MEILSIVQVGLGPVGRSIARLVLERGEGAGLALIGAVDPGGGMPGRDIGELVGAETAGVSISPAIGPLLEKSPPDLVLHATGSRLPDVAAQFRPVLEKGVSIVSTCEELAYPFVRHPALSEELDRLARSTRAVLLGSGVNPGFVMDSLVARLLGACRSVHRVRVVRIVDASTRREPLQRKIGAGLTIEQFASRRAAGTIGHVGLPESAHMLADLIGLSRDRRVFEELAPRIAAHELSVGGLDIAPGSLTGIEQSVRIEDGGVERVRLDIVMAVGAESPGDTIEVEGSPGFSVFIPGGLHGDEATAALIVNCAPLVRGLAPGLRTMLDVPVRYTGASG